MLLNYKNYNSIIKQLEKEDLDYNKVKFVINIPRARARMETNERYLTDDLYNGSVECYSLYITQQEGGYDSEVITNVYINIPNYGMGNIQLFPDGTVDFEKQFHVYALRNMDELDREIPRAFCTKYYSLIRDACHDSGKFPSEDYLQRMASSFRRDDMPKRLKKARIPNRIYDFKHESTREKSIFDDIVFI